MNQQIIEWLSECGWRLSKRNEMSKDFVVAPTPLGDEPLSVYLEFFSHIGSEPKEHYNLYFRAKTQQERLVHICFFFRPTSGIKEDLEDCCRNLIKAWQACNYINQGEGQ